MHRSTCRWHGHKLDVQCEGVCHDTSNCCPWPFVLWTPLSWARINGCVAALILQHFRSFYSFRGCVWTNFRVYSGVEKVEKESLATDPKTRSYLKPVWNIDAADVQACPWHRRCFSQVELVKRSCWSFTPSEIASLSRFRHAQRLFFQDAPWSQ